MSSPFSPENEQLFKNWSNTKIENAFRTDIQSIDSLFVDIADPAQLTTTEIKSIHRNCSKNSFCLYRVDPVLHNNKNKIHLFMAQLGLQKLDTNICADADSLTSIKQTEQLGQHDYIPYSNKQLSWHTDGYYNPKNEQINSMLLHCVQPATEGGESLFMDHEIAYLLLRNKNPDYIKVLMEDDALTIPANILNGKTIREAQTGPVFSINQYGHLHMRFSARKRNISWKQNDLLLEAIDYLNSLLNRDSPYIIKHKLKPGEGIVCKNILHCRTSFVDSKETEKKRLLYRGRYYDCLPDVY